MRSSISNFSFPQQRSPDKNWGVMWVSTLMMTVLLVSGAEAFWRSRGHAPTVVDNERLWAYHRSHLQGNEAEVVCLGASRMQCGFATETFYDRYPNVNFRQLAVAGKVPITLLKDLAYEESFRGVVICALQAPSFQAARWDDLQEYISYYHQEYGISAAFDNFVTTNIQGKLVVLNPQVRLDNVAYTILTKRSLPLPRFQTMRADRWRMDNYHSHDDITQRRREAYITASCQKAESARLSVESWFRDVQQVEAYVLAIQARGGKVVFVRFPTDGPQWEYDQIAYPRAKYWNRLADFTAAETIHFADFLTLARFKLPDTSHLDSSDAPAFTAALLDILEDRQIIKQ